MADATTEAVTSDSGLLDWLTGGSTTSSVALLLCVLFGAYAAYVITNEPQGTARTHQLMRKTTKTSRRATSRPNN